MIRRSTVVYITVLLVVATVYLYLNSREQSAEAEATPGPTSEVSYLFPEEAGAPAGILIQAKSGDTVELARNSERAWVLRKPIASMADQGLSEAAASQVMTLRVLEKTYQIDPSLGGLRDPAYILTVLFDNGTERTARIGVVTPTESGYYVQGSSGDDVLIVSKRSLDVLLTLLSNPPYLETPTPSPAPPDSGTAISVATPTP